MQHDLYRQQGDELLPCCYGNTSYAENTMPWFEKWWFVRFDFEKTIPATGGRGWGVKERKGTDRERASEREREREREREKEREKRASETARRKWEEEEEEGESRRGFTSSNLQQCFRQFRSFLSLYFYKESRNTSSAIHFISIPTPASHLHSVSCASPFHFSACHYISWMITYWQFLHWHRMGQDRTLPASKAGEKWRAFFQPCLSFSFSLRSSTLTPSPSLRFHRLPSPHPPLHPPKLLIKSRSLLSDPYEPLQGPVTPLGPEAGSHVSPLYSNKWTRRSIARLIGCHDIHANSGAPQSHIALLYRHYRHITAVHFQAGFIKLNLTFFKSSYNEK